MTVPTSFEHDTLHTANPQPVSGALLCDSYHHYYHYQASTQYLWLARICYLLGEPGEAERAIKKALFQDHFNEEALAIKDKGSADDIAHTYSKHPLFDAQFCDAVGRKQVAATALHDAGVRAVLEGNVPAATQCFESAIAAAPMHSNSHFWLGKCRLSLGDPLGAKRNLQEAISLSHIDHEAYHKAASGEHVKRARAFMACGELDLAINDFTKALDLDRTNQDAATGRETAQKIRANK